MRLNFHRGLQSALRPSVLFFFTAIFLAFLPQFLPAVDTYDEVSGSGLFIDSVPGGAKVFVDGAERGLTPLYLPLQAGEYSIRLNKDGYVDRRISVTVRRGSRVELSLDLEDAKGQLLLEITLPRNEDEASPEYSVADFDPAVYVDGVQVYQRSLSLPIGWRTISVEAFGWEKWSRPIFIEQDRIQRLEVILTRAAFKMTNPRLRRNRFNPVNSGALGRAEGTFEVSAPGSGTLEVYTREGRKIYEGSLGPFSSWLQQLSWNGRDSEGRMVPDGMYTLRIKVRASGTSGAESRAELTVELDSSLEIRPLSIAGAQGGLLFSPSPETLPRGSYQVSGVMLLGRPPGEAEAFRSLPLGLALRVSPLDRLEFAAALNVSPHLSGTSPWGGGVSAKWILSPGSGAFNAAASLSYGYFGLDAHSAGTENYYQSPFGMGAGLCLALPLSLRVGGDTLTVDILFSPRLLWAGPRGYPGSWIPRPGAGTGIHLQYGPASGGLSFQGDYDFDAKAPGPLVSTLEFSYLTPINMILFVSAGGWVGKGWEKGAFFGLGLGFMY
jgi:hypothetical protein